MDRDHYRRYLPELVSAIRKGAPGARLVWGATTPVRKDKAPGPSNERIEARNRIARELCEKQGIPVDDLNAAMAGHSDLHSDDVHFKAEGYAILAAQVAGSVEKMLPGK